MLTAYQEYNWNAWRPEGLVEALARRVPPAVQGTIRVLKGHGHHVQMRENRNGSLRYRVDGSNEMTALQMARKFRRYGI